MKRKAVEEVDGGDEDAEDLENARRRRGAIKEGYTESDDEDLNNSTESAVKGVQNDDMFGDSFDGESEGDERKARKKNVEWVSKEKIYDEGAENYELEGEDEVKIDKFNMDQELEEGGFDADFNYIRSKDEHQMHDNWLQGVTESDIRKASQARARQQAREKELKDAEDDLQDEESLLLGALRLMKPGESLATSIKRLGVGSLRLPAWKRKKLSSKDGLHNGDVNNGKELDELISISDKLISLGQLDIMDSHYEAIVRILRAKGALGEEWQIGDAVPLYSRAKLPAAENEKPIEELWFLKWDDNEEAELHGPFKSETMNEWKQSGFFESKGFAQRQTDSSFTPANKAVFL